VVNSPGKFYRQSTDAARSLGRRAVLLAGGKSGELADLHGPQVFVCDYAPHSLLFPAPLRSFITAASALWRRRCARGNLS